MNFPQQSSDKFLDDPDELLAEEQSLEEQAEHNEKIAALDCLDDLDELLSESVTLRAAKKQKAQGRRLTQEELDVLARAKALEEIAAWEPRAAVIHVIHTNCACGASTNRVSRLYELSFHKKTSAQKLTQVEESQLPAHKYETVEEVGFCCECLALEEYANLTTDDYSLLSSLGVEAEVVMTEDDAGLVELQNELDVLAELQEAELYEPANNREERLAALKKQLGETPMPPADAFCHNGLLAQEACGHCSRISALRTTLIQEIEALWAGESNAQIP